MGVAVVFGAVLLRSEVLAANRTADLPAHLDWVRWAEHRIEAGHSPLDGWYPNLSLGAPQFHQYQSLPHIVGGYLATIFGAPEVVRWTTYVLLVTWPISVAIGMLLIGFDRRAAAIAAVLAPLVSSTTSFGYEWSSYVFSGLGLWTQLVGMWLLPIAMGLTWRAVARGRGYTAAGVVLALTICCHFITAYVAAIWVTLLVLAGARRFWPRVRRAALFSVGAVLLAAWLVVPLFVDLKWVGVPTEIAPDLRDSYGAGQVMRWFVSGELFDHGHTSLPVLTVLVCVGLIVCTLRFRADAAARVLMLFFVVNLLVFFGRPTFGALFDVFPGIDNLFLHRFVAPVQLAGVMLAGVGASALLSWVVAAASGRVDARHAALVLPVVLLVGVLALVPAIVDRWDYAAIDRNTIHTQRALEHTEGKDLDALLARAKAMGGGRIYGGTAVDGGLDFDAGLVPVFEAITNASAPGIGFFGREASLSTDTEWLFDPKRPSMYDLYGVRFVIWPRGKTPPAGGTRIMARGRYALWTVGRGGYLGVYDTVGPAITADRQNLLSRTDRYVLSSLPDRHVTRPVAFGGDAAAKATAAGAGDLSGSPGSVLRETERPDDGRFAGDVHANRPAVVVLKASFHRRWHATVDGKPVAVQMVAPSLVAVAVPAGDHHVVFQYEPFPGTAYGALGVIGLLGLVMLVVADRRARTQAGGGSA